MNPAKFRAFELYGQGLRPSEVQERMPELSKAMVYEYSKLYKKEAQAKTSPLELLDGGAEGDASTEIRWLKRELRKRIQQAQAQADPRAISQLGNTYLRAIELENSLKIDEPDDEALSGEERLARINELIANARKRQSAQSSESIAPQDQPNEQ